jgi:hypothetical protein
MTANLNIFVLCSVVFGGVSTAAAEPENPPTLGCRETSVTRLRIGLNAMGPLSGRLAAEIPRVVDQVWRQYGVTVAWSASTINAIPRAADLVMLVQLEPIASAPTALGAVIFGPSGPAPIIRLSASTAIGLIGRSRFPTLHGQQLLQIDSVARDIGTLLGHAAAHELGHILLSTKTHAHEGLMAPVYSVDLFAANSVRTRLEPQDERRLSEILGRGSPCGMAGADRPHK